MKTKDQVKNKMDLIYTNNFNTIERLNKRGRTYKNDLYAHEMIELMETYHKQNDDTNVLRALFQAVFLEGYQRGIKAEQLYQRKKNRVRNS